MITELGKRVDVHSKLYNKELENIKRPNKKEFSSWNNTIEGMNSRPSSTEEFISDLGDRIIEITQLK